MHNKKLFCLVMFVFLMFSAGSVVFSDDNADPVSIGEADDRTESLVPVVPEEKPAPKTIVEKTEDSAEKVGEGVNKVLGSSSKLVGKGSDRTVEVVQKTGGWSVGRIFRWLDIQRYWEGQDQAKE